MSAENLENAMGKMNLAENVKDDGVGSTQMYTKSSRLNDEIIALGLRETEVEITLEKTESYKKMLVKWGRKYDDWFLKTRPEYILKHGDDSIRAFLHSLAKSYAPTTLWTYLSYIRDFCWKKYNVDRNNLPLTTEYLKMKEKRWMKRKAKVFSFEEMEQFWTEAPDDAKHLQAKIATLIGFFGAARSQEISTLKYSAVRIFRRYEFLAFGENVREPTASYLRQITRSGTYKTQHLGPNAISNITKFIARYLGKSEAERYTSQGLRAGSATALAEAGATVEQLKLHGNWKSTSVMEGYLRETNRFRTLNANMIAQKRARSPSAPNEVQDEAALAAKKPRTA